MKFIHMADVHLGSFRSPRMRKLTIEAFDHIIEQSIEKQIDFLLIAGDLFHTSLPSIEVMNHCVLQFQKLKKANIPIYLIAGSHDYSPSGKTILDVLENAELIQNVFKAKIENAQLNLTPAFHEPTQTHIAGIPGRGGMLDRMLYEDLNNTALESLQGNKIFLFHTALSELSQKDNIPANTLGMLPKGFNYYAGGHIHIRNIISKETHQNLVYPGPVFPNSFSELEELEHGSYVFYDNGTITHETIKLKPVVAKTFSTQDKIPEEIITEVQDWITTTNLNQAITLLRFEGTLKFGSIAELDLPKLTKQIYDKGAFFVMKNTTKVDFDLPEDLHTDIQSIDELEDTIISNHCGKFPLLEEPKEKEFFKSLLATLHTEKNEDQTKDIFEQDLKQKTKAVFKEFSLEI